jgi:hypothetical protein
MFNDEDDCKFKVPQCCCQYLILFSKVKASLQDAQLYKGHHVVSCATLNEITVKDNLITWMNLTVN